MTYLPPPEDPEIGYPLTLDPLTNPHPARPAPPTGEIVAGSDYELFWSLSFALTSSTWRTIGGFCEHYRGYGAEDTDFAQMARAAGVPMRWVGGATRTTSSIPCPILRWNTCMTSCVTPLFFTDAGDGGR